MMFRFDIMQTNIYCFTKWPPTEGSRDLWTEMGCWAKPSSALAQYTRRGQPHSFSFKHLGMATKLPDALEELDK